MNFPTIGKLIRRESVPFRSKDFLMLLNGTFVWNWINFLIFISMYNINIFSKLFFQYTMASIINRILTHTCILCMSRKNLNISQSFEKNLI